MIAKIAAWSLVLAIVVLTLVPAPLRPTTGLQHDLEHLLAFTAAGIAVGYAYRLRLSWLLLLAIGFAMVLELSQIPLPTRHARFEDFVVNGSASSLGILMMSLAARFSTKARPSGGNEA